MHFQYQHLTSMTTSRHHQHKHCIGGFRDWRFSFLQLGLRPLSFMVLWFELHWHTHPSFALVLVCERDDPSSADVDHIFSGLRFGWAF
jgi:hypothetical protein